MTAQAQMKITLEQSGLPFKEVEVYGSQIVVTAHSQTAAEKWASLLGRFSRVRGLVKSRDDAKHNRGGCLNPSTVIVYRVFATVAVEAR